MKALFHLFRTLDYDSPVCQVQFYKIEDKNDDSRVIDAIFLLTWVGDIYQAIIWNF